MKLASARTQEIRSVHHTEKPTLFQKVNLKVQTHIREEVYDKNLESDICSYIFLWIVLRMQFALLHY